MKKGAVLSENKEYRYRLWRIWDESKPKVMFIMLNPSTADEMIDDPAIKRCISFAKSWGYGGLYVGNLFAYRSKNPEMLLYVNGLNRDLLNDYHIRIMSEKCESIVCAWGNSPILKKLKFKPALSYIEKPLYCIELSKNNTPKHPLYLKGNLKMKSYKNN